ncbi:hypothetical protein HPB51_018988 [Rhipicephalus microplus]|uniref:Secreted protein n=1 Tax=Rhipicephalus microplus TaxID=6941 RepID=A0A9J6D6J6_RHIMP|nr:hypothetical protein HPB51_018988 [Rhipicephalus microplus]
MQVLLVTVVRLLMRGLAIISLDPSSNCTFLSGNGEAGTVPPPSATAPTLLPAPWLDYSSPASPWTASSKSTSPLRAPIYRERSAASASGLGSCDAMQFAYPFLPTMQVVAIAVICAALPATILAIPHAPSTCVEPCIGRISVAFSYDKLTAPDTDFVTIATWDTPMSATSIASSAIRSDNPRAPNCGLGGCATGQLPKLLLFNMQVVAIAVICAALPATILAIPHAPFNLCGTMHWPYIGCFLI